MITTLLRPSQLSISSANLFSTFLTFRPSFVFRSWPEEHLFCVSNTIGLHECFAVPPSPHPPCDKEKPRQRIPFWRSRATDAACIDPQPSSLTIQLNQTMRRSSRGFPTDIAKIFWSEKDKKNFNNAVNKKQIPLGEKEEFLSLQCQYCNFL